MALKLVLAPAVEPVLLADVKTALRITDTSEDTLLPSFITAARRHCEFLTGRSFITTQWQLVLDSFDDLLEIPRPPLQVLTSINYIDVNGVSQLLAPAMYYVDGVSEPARVTPVATQWPETAFGQNNVVTVLFTSGYGAAQAAVPMEVQQWIILAVGDLYANRERSSAQVLQALTFADGLLDEVRLWPR